MFTLYEGWTRTTAQLPRLFKHMEVDVYQYLGSQASEVKRLLARRTALKKEYDKAVAAVATKEGKTPKAGKEEEHQNQVDNLKLR